MDYSESNKFYMPDGAALVREQDMGHGFDTPHETNHVEDNIDQILKYLASEQTVLSDRAYGNLVSIMRERSHGRFELGQVSPGPLAGDQMQAVRPCTDETTQRRGTIAMKQTALLECPKSMVGRVIGKAGGTIKALQEYTGAMIQIDQSTDPTRVTIAGSPQSLQLAISMVSDIIQGKFKGFAMLRQIAAAKEMAHQHGGDGMGAHPVYVQGYGFMPPTQSAVGGYSTSPALVPHHQEESHELYSAVPIQPRIQRPFPTSQQQSQYLATPNTLNSNDYNLVLTKLMQLAALDHQRDQNVPAADRFLPEYSGMPRHHVFVNTPKPDVLPTPNSGLFTGFLDKGNNVDGHAADSLF